MFARTRFTALIGTFFLVPLMFACEGYDEPGQDDDLLETEQQEEVRPSQDEQARPGQQQQQEMETRQQRREAETERAERPERPAPPEETDEEAGDEEEMTERMTERMSMTEFSVEIPEDLASGSYTLSCPVPEDARRQQAGQEQTQPTRDDVQLRITVRQGQGQQEMSTNNDR